MIFHLGTLMPSAREVRLYGATHLVGGAFIPFVRALTYTIAIGPPGCHPPLRFAP